MTALMPNVNMQGVSTEKIMPSDVAPRLYGSDTQQSLFRFQTNDIISLTTTGGSSLMNWMPARGVNTWNDSIAHLSWIAPDAFDGSKSYADFLVDQGEIGECDFGDGFTYQICEYDNDMHRVAMSTRSEPIKAEYLGMKLWERMPQQVLRGETRGITLANDRDWSLARLGLGFEEHQNWNILYGDDEGYPNTYEGLNAMITSGWVRSHAAGRGSCDFVDPIVYSGVGLTSKTLVIRRLAALVRRLLGRMKDRNFMPSGDDMVIVMNPIMWYHLADQIAYGALTNFFKPSDVTLNVTPDGVQRERDRIKNGGLGEGFIPIEGRNIPVITDSRIGYNSTSTGGNPAITGDIFVLTKRFRGITILEHQYLDWGKMPMSPFENYAARGEYQPAFFQGNMIKVSPLRVDGNDRCWYYGAEMYGRLVSYMNMLQGRINDVTIEVEVDDEFESGSFTSQNFYPYGGATGGAGTALLTEL